MYILLCPYQLLHLEYPPEGHHLGNIDHVVDYQLPMNNVNVKDHPQ